MCVMQNFTAVASGGRAHLPVSVWRAAEAHDGLTS
jgi:hypothetical protein